MNQALYIDVISPNTVDIKSIEDYMYKICSALAQKNVGEIDHWSTYFTHTKYSHTFVQSISRFFRIILNEPFSVVFFFLPFQ